MAREVERCCVRRVVVGMSRFIAASIVARTAARSRVGDSSGSRRSPNAAAATQVGLAAISSSRAPAISARAASRCFRCRWRSSMNRRMVRRPVTVVRRSSPAATLSISTGSSWTLSSKSSLVRPVTGRSEESVTTASRLISRTSIDSRSTMSSRICPCCGRPSCALAPVGPAEWDAAVSAMAAVATSSLGGRRWRAEPVNGHSC